MAELPAAAAGPVLSRAAAARGPGSLLPSQRDRRRSQPGIQHPAHIACATRLWHSRKAIGPDRAARDNRSWLRPSWPHQKSATLPRTLPRNHARDRPQPGLHPWRRHDQHGASAKRVCLCRPHRPFPSRFARACVPGPIPVMTATSIAPPYLREAIAARQFPAILPSSRRSPEQGSNRSLQSSAILRRALGGPGNRWRATENHTIASMSPQPPTTHTDF